MQKYRHHLQLFLMLFGICFTSATADTLFHFISRRGDRLYDGDKEFRFVSFNVPNLHLIEDDFSFTHTNNWVLPTSFEIRDAMESVMDAGGTVIRQYCLRIQRNGEPPFMPKHVPAWRTYFEPAFLVMDTVLALANEYGIRLIIPFLEGPPWWGPKKQFARLRDGIHRFEGSSVEDDYRHLVGYVLNRRNTVTGVQYKDDKTILCWETGNEMHTSSRWLREMTNYIKSIDGNHLVIDGNYGVRTAALDDPNTDIVSNHFYKKGAGGITRDLKKTNGKKVYIVGEWGWSKEKAEEVLQRTVHSTAAGGLIWSLRFRYRTGGFTWHKGEGLHWPGGFLREELDDEREILAAVRKSAFSIRGLSPPPHTVPKAPKLLPIEQPPLISWQGSAGALFYHIERADAPEGPWKTVGDSIDETVVAFRPLFCDTTAVVANNYYYRVYAHGPGGTSFASNSVGPVTVSTYTLVDEYLSHQIKYARLKGTKFTDEKPWRFKYDFHRRSGSSGDFIEYHLNGNVSEVRIYAFFPKKTRNFGISLSDTGTIFIPQSVHVQLYPYCCADPRDRLRLPALFSTTVKNENYRKVRIYFPRGRAQIGRCEIDYR